MSAIEWTDVKTCSRCDEQKSRSDFARDRSRPDGLTYWCRTCRNRRGRETYTRKAGPPKGRRFVRPRDGDRKQARRRVNHLVDVGLLPPPASLPCVDCGHIGDGPRHEYDHHLGYAPEHHEDVEAVCAPCHRRR